MKVLRIGFGDLIVAIVATGWLAITAAQEVEVQPFTQPKGAEMVSPTYPDALAMRREEGTVVVEFMVGTDGKPFDPIVIESIGHRYFRAQALDALMQSQFEPALLDGEAIVGSHRVLYQFNMQAGQSGKASSPFASAYRRLQRAMQDNDVEEFREHLAALEELGARNRYEHAYLGLARYSNAALDGDEREQLRQLRQALSVSWSAEDPVYLDEELTTDLRRTQLQLQLRQNFFAEALNTFEIMQEKGDEEGIAMFQAAIDSVMAIRQNDAEYLVALALDDSGHTSMLLHKTHFALVEGQGALAEVTLRCTRQHVAFPVERDISYDVPPEWGECSIDIVGDSGATFRLLQH